MEQNKKSARTYETPQNEVVLFETQDVIFESNDNFTPWNTPNPSI